MPRIARQGWIWVALFLLLGACGEAEGAGSTRLCIPGETRTCTGPGACSGGQACLPSGAGFGECDCGSNEAVPDAGLAVSTCSPGEPRVCIGARQCEGTQVCSSDGAAFSACVCKDTAPALVTNVVGAPCQTSTDCGRDLECWSDSAASFLGIVGGAAHGYCTALCASSDDCARRDIRSLCWSAPGQQGMCVPSCLSKDPLFSESKCLNRADLTCWSSAALGQEALSSERQGGVCLPSCGSDADCPNRFCDFVTGLCQDVAPSGAAIGEPCTADGECVGGLCLTFGNGAAVCSAQCTYGAGACGYAPASTSRDAVCALPFLRNALISEGVGDLGLCLEVCDVGSDCTAPNSVCQLAELNTGRAGVCDPSTPLPLNPDAGAP